jgi:hypothetical protein
VCLCTVHVCSASHVLSGFYQADDQSQFLAFVSVSSLEGRLEARAVRDLSAVYESARGTKRVLTRNEAVTLEALREQALLLHFQQSAAAGAAVGAGASGAGGVASAAAGTGNDFLAP